MVFMDPVSTEEDLNFYIQQLMDLDKKPRSWFHKQWTALTERSNEAIMKYLDSRFCLSNENPRSIMIYDLQRLHYMLSISNQRAYHAENLRQQYIREEKITQVRGILAEVTRESQDENKPTNKTQSKTSAKDTASRGSKRTRSVSYLNMVNNHFSSRIYPGNVEYAKKAQALKMKAKASKPNRGSRRGKPSRGRGKPHKEGPRKRQPRFKWEKTKPNDDKY